MYTVIHTVIMSSDQLRWYQNIRFKNILMNGDSFSIFFIEYNQTYATFFTSAKFG